MKRLRSLVVIIALTTASASQLACTPQAQIATTPDAARAQKASSILKVLTAFATTAQNLNAQQGQLHLTDKVTADVKTYTLLSGVFVNAWGSGATTLAAAKTSLDSAQLDAATLQAARAAIDKAIVDHTAGASTLVVVVDAYTAFRASLPVDASSLLASALTIVDGVMSVLQ
jgi:hypothetical protein